MKTCVYLGSELASYAFGDDHPFGPLRHDSFEEAFKAQELDTKVTTLEPHRAERSLIEMFHTAEYVSKVYEKSKTGHGHLDHGDTPAFKGVYESASYVVGSVIEATDRLLANEFKHAFIPIAGLHHASRTCAAGFCAFNDCGVVIEYLKSKGLTKILYVDIDAHHGDGVYYSFEDDPALIFVDIHEDGQYIYPGTGSANETGTGPAKGYKLNIPMPPGTDDKAFLEAWSQAEKFIDKFEPEFILLQCGADSLEGDPITHMKCSADAHGHTTRSLVNIANKYANDRLLVMGGGGYNHDNIAAAWSRVVAELI